MARRRARRGRRVTGGVLILTLITSACTQDAPSDPERAPPEGLPASRPPLQLASLDATTACPTARGRTFDRPSAPFGGIALGLGGRVQAIVAVPHPERVKQGVVVLAGLPKEKGWYQIKWLWFTRDLGPLLIRGRQLDGADPVRHGDDPSSASARLKIASGPGVNFERGWRHIPGATWVRGPGCYGWQVDGRGFSDTIIFEAAGARRR
jgi:hypothetical protein